MVEHRVDVRPEALALDGRRTGERRDRSGSRDELAVAQREELTDAHAVPGHEESLAAVESTHDLAALVAELPLRDPAGHGAIVAPVLRTRFEVR